MITLGQCLIAAGVVSVAFESFGAAILFIGVGVFLLS